MLEGSTDFQQYKQIMERPLELHRHCLSKLPQLYMATAPKVCHQLSDAGDQDKVALDKDSSKSSY